jgi:hypothetical protein
MTGTAASAVSVGQTDVDNVDLACGPAECLVAWTSGGTVWVRLVDSSGAPMAAPASVTGAVDAPRVAWDGVEFVLTSVDSSVNAVRWISVNGSMSAPQSSLANDAGVGNGVTTYALASNGARVNLVVESTGGHVYGLRVTNDLAPPPDAGGAAGTDGGLVGAADAAAADAEAGAGVRGDASSDGKAGSSSSGSSSADGSEGPSPPESSKSGCGCVAAGSDRSFSSIAAAAAFAALLGMGRTRRSRRARAPGSRLR